jgi:hypothetical protein
VPLHDCADVAGPQTVLGNARVRITSPYMSKGMSSPSADVISGVTARRGDGRL